MASPANKQRWFDPAGHAGPHRCNKYTGPLIEVLHRWYQQNVTSQVPSVRTTVHTFQEVVNQRESFGEMDFITHY